MLIDRDDPARMVVLLRPGLALTQDGGRVWSFVCGAIAGIAGDEPYPAVIAGERLLVGGFVGLYGDQYGDQAVGCGWSRLEAGRLPPGHVVSLLANEDGSVQALIAPSDAAAGLFVSHDQGWTWTQRGAPLKAASPSSLARAPSEPRRMYLAGASVWTSSDAGESWREQAEVGSGCGEILAVDPTDARRLYLRCAAAERDRILVSADGGATFEPWAELPQIGGLAIAPDGSSVWVGSRAGGLWRADAAGALELLHDGLHVGCVQYESDTLWVCARDDRGFDAYALATSRDGGETLTPFLLSADVARLRTCGDPEQTRICNGEWNQWQSDVYQGQAVATAVSATDAAAATAAETQPRPHAAAPRVGCAVALGRGASPWWVALALALAWIGVAARNRTRTSAAEHGDA